MCEHDTHLLQLQPKSCAAKLAVSDITLTQPIHRCERRLHQRVKTLRTLAIETSGLSVSLGARSGLSLSSGDRTGLAHFSGPRSGSGGEDFGHSWRRPLQNTNYRVGLVHGSR
ncbi:hypothetical protein Zmor_005901 [Zophobas morio]|uniref:Uncharacterized protein n=1 Tax=Zophobas morio TaxID=2755281 RepID=A0AA38MMF4_9CUCU|nr:hypothetical protein Zmor_005901 [Zophobas morio]